MTSPLKHRLSERGDDLNETPPIAVEALLRVEKLPLEIWEPACGPGAIVKVLRAAGHVVHASDLVDWGCPDSQARIDFLMEHTAPCDCGLTNPPFKNANDFVAHALDLCPRVIMLLPITFLESEGRSEILERRGLARVHVFRKRLPMMHRHGWDGPRSTSQRCYAWFVWEREHNGPATLHRL
jgi:hypothetical protein